jgi:hypothetical protein
MLFGIGKLIRHLQIKSCIEKGGVWNHELNKCDTIPYATLTLKTNYYWHTAYDSISNKEYLEKGKLLDTNSKSTAALLNVLNNRPEICKIEYIDLKHDTLYIKIVNDEALTEQMGTTGAYCYLGETVFTLTENDSIQWIYIDMIEGSHARPGIYDRNDFNDLLVK